MNKRQLISMWVGIGLVVVACFAFQGEEFFRMTTMVTFVTGGCIITFKDKQPKDDQKK